MAGWRQPDFWARLLALLTFGLGVVLMVLVFVWASRVFNELGVGKELALHSNPSDRTPLAEWATRWVLRVALLFVLGYVASLIAARGANFYLSIRSQERKGEGA